MQARVQTPPAWNLRGLFDPGNGICASLSYILGLSTPDICSLNFPPGENRPVSWRPTVRGKRVCTMRMCPAVKLVSKVNR